MRELHLFAGIGGGILAGHLLGHRCVGAVEIDPYCRALLAERQRDGSLEQFPIHDDVRAFDGRAWRGRVDMVCGGFPCQPWSVAGKHRGADDPRHLWPEFARIVRECLPSWVFAENVSLDAFREPWRDLRGMGYRVPPALRLSAQDVGAPHRRERWWLLAHADGGGLEGQRRKEQEPGEERALPCRHITERCGGWPPTPAVRRAPHGLPGVVDRLRGLGNAQVPIQAARAFQILMEMHYQ